MPALISNADVEATLRSILAAEGLHLSPRRSNGQTGVDIIATSATQSWHIECIGYKSSGSARAKDFYESFFRIVSRLNDGANHLVLALAKRAEVGLPARARQHKIAWERIAVTFPELEIWLVDTEARAVAKRGWREWLY